MGNKYKKSVPAVKVEDYKYPSKFGSHSSMIDGSLTEEIEEFFPEWVICQDEKGKYATERKKLDCGLADFNRYASDQHRKQTLGVIINPSNAVKV